MSDAPEDNKQNNEVPLSAKCVAFLVVAAMGTGVAYAGYRACSLALDGFTSYMMENFSPKIYVGRALGESHCHSKDKEYNPGVGALEYQVAMEIEGSGTYTVEYQESYIEKDNACDRLPHFSSGDKIIVSGQNRGREIYASTITSGDSLATNK